MSFELLQTSWRKVTTCSVTFRLTALVKFQAYAATGLSKKMKEVASEKIRKPFIGVFQRYDKEQEAKLAARTK